MRIAVIGSGDVGRTLAAGLVSVGHTVTLATREPERADLVAWAPAAQVQRGLTGAAVADAEVVVLATAWTGVADALAAADAADLDGKVLIDVTNPLRFTDRLELAVGHDDSGGEAIQRLAPGARVVKAFNTVGFELMISPDVPGGPPTMFLAGDDPDAREVVAVIAQQLGWRTHDCGDLRAARLLEPLALLWIEHAFRSGSRSHAFALLTP